MEQNQIKRPDRVSHSITLLYISLGVGVLRSVLEASMHSQKASIGFVLFTIFTTLGIMWFFIHMIGKGKKS